MYQCFLAADNIFVALCEYIGDFIVIFFNFIGYFNAFIVSESHNKLADTF